MANVSALDPGRRTSGPLFAPGAFALQGFRPAVLKLVNGESWTEPIEFSVQARIVLVHVVILPLWIVQLLRNRSPERRNVLNVASYPKTCSGFDVLKISNPIGHAVLRS
jgi:hypothetical protein